MTARRMSDILHARGIRGICVAPAPGASGPLQFPWNDFACVAIGYSLTEPVMHRTGPHQYNNTRLALRHARELGYAKIGVYIESVTNGKDDDNWLAAVLAHRHHHPEDVMDVVMVQEFVKEEFLEWFSRFRPEVVITQKDEVPEWLRSAGMKVPDHTGVVALNWTEELGECTGIDLNVASIGASAVDMLIGQLHRNAWGAPEHPQIVLVEGTWKHGETVRGQQS